MEKPFKLKSSQIEPLVPDMGFAYVTDMISVEGKPVDYMSRSEPNSKGDSGWIFYGGGETQEYMDDARNISLMGINTVANYDPEIISFLTYPPGTEIERNTEGKLQVISPGIEEPDVVFLYPVDAGTVQVTNNWALDVANRMFRRFDKGSLVIWRTGFTIWLNSFESNNSSIERRLQALLDEISPEKTDFQQQSQNGLHKIRYHLVEDIDGHKQSSVNIFGLAKNHQIQMSIYYDDPQYSSEIDHLWSTLKYVDEK